MTAKSKRVHYPVSQWVKWGLNQWTYQYDGKTRDFTKLKGVTAYHIAAMCNVSARQVNRIMSRLWWEGLVGYREEKHKGCLRSKRVYAWVVDCEKDPEKGWCINRSYDDIPF